MVLLVAVVGDAQDELLVIMTVISLTPVNVFVVQVLQLIPAFTTFIYQWQDAVLPAFAGVA